MYEAAAAVKNEPWSTERVIVLMYIIAYILGYER